MNKPVKNSSGFTLVEIMITLLISAVIIAAIYTAYLSQQRVYLAQEQVAEMQQNIRAGVWILTRDIRMAGYDPTRSGIPGVTGATVSELGFTQDLDGDGTVTTDPGETITFTLNGDADNDGIADGGGVSTLGRKTGTGPFQPFAENIQAIEFRYFDSTGAVTAVPGDIHSIQISILARAGQGDRKFTNNMTYMSASGANWGSPYGDNFRRRLLITTVECRNKGF